MSELFVPMSAIRGVVRGTPDDEDMPYNSAMPADADFLWTSEGVKFTWQSSNNKTEPEELRKQLLLKAWHWLADYHGHVQRGTAPGIPNVYMLRKLMDDIQEALKP